MTATSLVALLIVVVAFGANADPEQSYQGGKAIRDSITGTSPKVDDRDLEQQGADWLKQKGAEAGGKPSSSNSNQTTKSGKSGSPNSSGGEAK